MEKMNEIATNSIKFWEFGRLVYNLVLALIVIGFIIAGQIHGRDIDYLDMVLTIFVFGMGANVLYCSAYVIDIFVQVSGYRMIWRKYRWILLLLGILLASIFTWTSSETMFM